jgi:hypothetical protein
MYTFINNLETLQINLGLPQAHVTFWPMCLHSAFYLRILYFNSGYRQLSDANQVVDHTF